MLHRVGLLPLIAGGLALGTAGTLLVLANFDTSTGLLVTGLLVTGAGLGAAMSVASSAIMGNAPASRAGMASSCAATDPARPCRPTHVTERRGRTVSGPVSRTTRAAAGRGHLNDPAGPPGAAY